LDNSHISSANQNEIFTHHLEQSFMLYQGCGFVHKTEGTWFHASRLHARTRGSQEPV